MGWTYLVHAKGTDMYKIGMTSQLPEDRLSSLQTASPHPLELCYTAPNDYPRELEDILHNQWSEARESGEWFRLDSGQVADVCCTMRIWSRTHIIRRLVHEDAKKLKARCFSDTESQLAMLFMLVLEEAINGKKLESLAAHLREWDGLGEHGQSYVNSKIEEAL